LLFLLCDLSEAFDKVWYRGILHKKQTNEITGNDSILNQWRTLGSKHENEKGIIKKLAIVCDCI
jgi:hypothetical protein